MFNNSLAILQYCICSVLFCVVVVLQKAPVTICTLITILGQATRFLKGRWHSGLTLLAVSVVLSGRSATVAVVKGSLPTVSTDQRELMMLQLTFRGC